MRARSLSAPTLPTLTPLFREVVLDGRRYRLVPIDENEPTAIDFSEPQPAQVAPPVKPPLPEAAIEDLTARETQIVLLVAEGLVNKQIACHLGISEWTVSTHLRRIFVKLDVDTRAAMVRKCFDARPRLLRTAET